MKAIPLANHLTESELEDRIRSAKDASIRDRCRAFLWILQGEKRREIAKRLGVSRISIQNWVKRYNSEGESGLPRKSGQGRKRIITPKCLPDGVSATFLPAYSPELNPVERFFQELRRRIANRIFSSLQELEDALVEAINEYYEDTDKVRQLCGYPWILEQLQTEDNDKLNC